VVVAVSRGASHTMAKRNEDAIRLVAGLGKAGVMGVVVAGGEVRPGDSIRVELPSGEHRPLEPV
jgi:MOSC domain-containing protein YiiM